MNILPEISKLFLQNYDFSFESFDIAKFETLNYEDARALFIEFYYGVIKVYICDANIKSQNDLLESNRRHFINWYNREGINNLKCLFNLINNEAQKEAKNFFEYKAYFLLDALESMDEYPIVNQLYSVPKECIEVLGELVNNDFVREYPFNIKNDVFKNEVYNTIALVSGMLSVGHNFNIRRNAYVNV